MLVLSRKVGEEIVIGNNIHLMVVAIKGDKVRIGISAPKEVVVDRQEVHEKRTNSCSEGPALTPTLTDPSNDLRLFARKNSLRL
jgi:carbon storage regulator CsrA